MCCLCFAKKSGRFFSQLTPLQGGAQPKAAAAAGGEPAAHPLLEKLMAAKKEAGKVSSGFGGYITSANPVFIPNMSKLFFSEDS